MSTSEAVLRGLEDSGFAAFYPWTLVNVLGTLLLCRNSFLLYANFVSDSVSVTDVFS